MKKKILTVIAIILLLAIIQFEIWVFASIFYETKWDNEVPTIEIEQTQEEQIHYYTHEELSQLYTCKSQNNLKDSSILELSYEDAQLLMKVARAEGGPTLDGQLWSMRTIINRMQDDSFPDTLHDVLFQVDKNGKYQFEVIETEEFENADVNSNTHVALAMIEGGWNETQGALYWEADTNSETSWHKTHLTYVKTINGNIYYR